MANVEARFSPYHLAQIVQCAGCKLLSCPVFFFFFSYLDSYLRFRQIWMFGRTSTPPRHNCSPGNQNPRISKKAARASELKASTHAVTDALRNAGHKRWGYSRDGLGSTIDSGHFPEQTKKNAVAPARNHPNNLVHVHKYFNGEVRDSELL